MITLYSPRGLLMEVFRENMRNGDFGRAMSYVMERQSSGISAISERYYGA